uniref:Uncharacterized protein LOC105643541 isoform X2 n=1 Tax=Rhizophora mucronata TaxID=61149 RepID=A0A2P2MDF9_RHIMU
MLENPTPTAPPDAVKRYAPPNQRNRSLNRRKSDRFNNYYVNDGERNQPHGAASRSVPVADHDGDVGSSNVPNESSRPGLIALEGCSRGEASQLLSDRVYTLLFTRACCDTFLMWCFCTTLEILSLFFLFLFFFFFYFDFSLLLGLYG